jgi:hypothetical protein
LHPQRLDIMPKASLPILALLLAAGCASSGKPVQGPEIPSGAWQLAVDPDDKAEVAAAEAEFIVAAERFEESGQNAMLSVIDLALHGGLDAQKVKSPLGRWQEALGEFHAVLERYRGSRSQADATELLRLIGLQQTIMEQIKDAIPEAKAELAG